MGSISDALEIKVLDHILKNTALAVPTNIYIALSIADPLDAGSGISEPVANGYARVVSNTWDVAASRATENTNQIDFPTATGAWGTITHWAIFDAVTGGNFLAHGIFSNSKVVGNGHTPFIAAGDIDVSVNAGGWTDYLANEMLDHIFKVGSFAQITNLFVGLTTANPTDAGLFTNEVSGNGYARKGHDAYDAAAAGASENTGAITFDTATGSWGTVTYCFIADLGAAGNMLLYGVLGASETYDDGDVAEFADGALDFTLD